jgi:methylenetetrahydrofolate reductase (NADPH)
MRPGEALSTPYDHDVATPKGKAVMRAYATPVSERVWQPDDAAKLRLRELVADFSTEITPAVAARHTALADLLPAGTRVYVAFVPGEDHRSVAATAARVRAEGLVPVPHFPARSILDRAQLEDYLRRVTAEAGVDEVLVIGGGLDLPRGAFAGTQALLETGLFEAYGIRTIGLAGHPEGQRELRAPGAAMTLQQKLAYARHSAAGARLVTQFMFEAEPLLAWERLIRAQGNHLPIHVGVPGPATVRSLLNYARLCGVGNSIRVLTRQAGNLFKLASLAYPDGLLTALAWQRASDPDCRIERLHFYPFGGLARTARWIERIRAGAFTLHDDGPGFTVEGAAE